MGRSDRGPDHRLLRQSAGATSISSEPRSVPGGPPSRRTGACCLSPVVRPCSESEIAFPKRASRRRKCFGTSTGSNVPARSLGARVALAGLGHDRLAISFQSSKRGSLVGPTLSTEIAARLVSDRVSPLTDMRASSRALRGALLRIRNTEHTEEAACAVHPELEAHGSSLVSSSAVGSRGSTSHVPTLDLRHTSRLAPVPGRL
jgi:hypothetical protein